ncbi:LysR family transcriptional regulator [Rhodophyticola sp. CCM32]|uniref:LysR family transcriptional regulator n=1 Tax=Rhodophyticola sp. CCM32 TaxID=2916397 RepID=UPI00143D08DD|nr:LysR family transcriptional regulator [Rhodophyticola sp. CCM32]
MKITVRQIRAFAAVAELQSFTAAAEQVNLTQSAVSMLVRQLEDTLGLALFVRTGRGVILTEFGAELRPIFARVMADLDGVQDAAQGLRSLSSGTLRLALTQVLAATWLPEILDIYRTRHPGITLEIMDSVGDRIVDTVAANEAEIGIGPARSHLPDVEKSPLWSVPIRLVTAAGSAAKTEHPHQWIHYSDEFDILLERTLRHHSWTKNCGSVRVRSLIPALAMVGTGNFATAAPSYAEVFAPSSRSRSMISATRRLRRISWSTFGRITPCRLQPLPSRTSRRRMCHRGRCRCDGNHLGSGP